ncbi:clc-like domain-containing protein [Ditylenchus destructor]|nr:clc-like domain-containing protein [Ditylenchus destructor]
MADEGVIRRSFLYLGIAFTLFGCIICALGIALPAWQVVELSELNAIHEHGIFYDCIRSETLPLERLRTSTSRPGDSSERQRYSHSDSANKRKSFEDSAEDRFHPPSVAVSPFSAKKCVYKPDSDASSTWTMRMAIEEGNPAARELLFHRFMPQHKAVIFFFIFSVIFSLISIVVGSCSACFVPNGILHVISVALAMCCSILGDVIFFMACTRDDNQHIQGSVHEYTQHLSYAFCVHVFGSVTLFAATLCSTVAAYLLVRKECKQHGCYNSKRNKKKKSRYSPYVAVTHAHSNHLLHTYHGSASQINLSHHDNHNHYCLPDDTSVVGDYSLYSSRYPSMCFHGPSGIDVKAPLKQGTNLYLSDHKRSTAVPDRLPPPPPPVVPTSRPIWTPRPVQLQASLPITGITVCKSSVLAPQQGFSRRPSETSASSAPITIENGKHISQSMASFGGSPARWLEIKQNGKGLSHSQQYINGNPPIVTVEDV